MKIFRRTAAAVLSAALLLPAALAAEAPDPIHARREDLDFLCAALEEVHPGFPTLAREAFAAKKAEIEESLPTASDQTFALDLQSLTALLRDSHTTTNLSPILSTSPLYPFQLGWYEESWVLLAAPAEYKPLLGQPVTALNGIPMDEVTARLSSLISADNPVKLRRQVSQVLMAQAVLAYVGLADEDSPLSLTLSGGDALSLTPLSPEECAVLAPDAMALLPLPAAPTHQQRKTAYFSQPLSEKVYYIQYNTCQEDPEDPMEAFAARVAADWDEGDYNTLLIDLRYNGGGSDGVLYPILMWAAGLVRQGHTVYGLIGEATFSSTIINAVEIQELGGILAGSPTSGSADHYGSTRGFTLPHSGIRVSCSQKFIDLETLFEAGVGLGVESLTPDLPVEQTLTDALAGRDTLVDAILARGEPFAPTEDDAALLTRGGFARLLWQAAGSPGAEECPFADVMPFSASLPAVSWCAQVGVALGNGETLFAPARPITVQEAALMLHRLAGSPAPTGEVPHAAAPWAAEAMAWLSPDLPPDALLTRTQAMALCQTLQ